MPLLNWISQKFAKSSADPTPPAPLPEASTPVATPRQPPPPVVAAAPLPQPVPQPAQQPKPRQIATATTLRLPWLQPLDRQMEAVGIAGVHAHVEAPGGSTVYVDPVAKKARIIYPDGRIKAWDGFKALDVRPDQRTWMMSWNLPGDLDSPRIIFSPMDENCDDEIIRQTGYEFYADDIEGHEKTRWPEFVRMVKDPFLNPFGFPLHSGVYVHAFVSFNLTFGEDGSTPSMEPVPETLPPTLDFPYRAHIGVVVAFTAKGQQVPVGWYRTKVMGYEIDTGRATHIECKSLDYQTTVHLSSDEIVQLLHDGKAQMGEVVEDQMPSF